MDENAGDIKITWEAYKHGSDPAYSRDLVAQWHRDLQVMSSRIKSMRQALYDELTRLKTPGTWEHIIQQNGMFSYTGLSPKQVYALKDKYHVYLLKSGRASISGFQFFFPGEQAEAEHLQEEFMDATDFRENYYPIEKTSEIYFHQRPAIHCSDHLGPKLYFPNQWDL
ncbi:hypothetical protein POX_c03560 [Penicillium oxalicum]|uniref:hypothetical protein n=1 Tax=Penicillium oxalicum TaxID=69781 RepID=UPI0020B7F77E|nr:hypothetical protein POX_c03560 [Penicillium oxalicum]KAI2790713.1 hypothetical protein POX_c03560 [Penicillium oxalicum]